MGNRAVITASKSKNIASSNDIGIYLHWNGGRDSIEGFLAYCDMKGYRSPSKDSYGWAYLAHVITNFFGDGMSCGVGQCKHLDCDNYDNGVYVIDGWKIVDRAYFNGMEQHEYPLADFMIGIDEEMPERERVGADYIRKWVKEKTEIKG